MSCEDITVGRGSMMIVSVDTATGRSEKWAVLFGVHSVVNTIWCTQCGEHDLVYTVW
jgi:hypothetical protein